jgi:hypothetical protein
MMVIIMFIVWQLQLLPFGFNGVDNRFRDEDDDNDDDMNWDDDDDDDEYNDDDNDFCCIRIL